MNRGWSNFPELNRKKHERYVENYNANPKSCKYCGKVIPYEKRSNNYCNSSCFASLNNLGVSRNKNYYDKLRGKPKTIQEKRNKQLATRNCKFCGSIIKPSRNWVTFCNNTCSTLYKTSEMIRQNQTTRSNKRRMKVYLIHVRGYKCEDCKLIQWKNQPIPLEIHHEDGDVDNMDLQNLKLLCPNCHVFTDTYKFKNHVKKQNGGFRSGQTGGT